MAEPNTPQDKVLYDNEYQHLTRDVDVNILNDKTLSYWGKVNINGSPSENEAGSITKIKEARTHVIVGSAAAHSDYLTLADAMAAFPVGGVDIELRSGAHLLTAPITGAGIKNVSIRGQGREYTHLVCNTGFCDVHTSSDCWSISDMKIERLAALNTNHGIVVDYPRRWSVERCNIKGFGGDSIWFKGGIHSEIKFNHIEAKDTTGLNGHAGIYITRNVTDTIVATTIRTEGNYIGAGVQYGLYTVRAQYCTHIDDVAELCQVGMRFELASSGCVISPYTEANSVAGIQLHDSMIPVIAPREMPVATWSAIAAADRRVTLIGRNYINPGKAIIFGPTTGPTTDPTTQSSIRYGNGTPEGVQVGVVGSLYLRTDGGAATTLYVKETGTGNTGWVAK